MPGLGALWNCSPCCRTLCRPGCQWAGEWLAGRPWAVVPSDPLEGQVPLMWGRGVSVVQGDMTWPCCMTWRGMSRRALMTGPGVAPSPCRNRVTHTAGIPGDLALPRPPNSDSASVDPACPEPGSPHGQECLAHTPMLTHGTLTPPTRSHTHTLTRCTEFSRCPGPVPSPAARRRGAWRRAGWGGSPEWTAEVTEMTEKA